MLTGLSLLAEHAGAERSRGMLEAWRPRPKYESGWKRTTRVRWMLRPRKSWNRPSAPALVFTGRSPFRRGWSGTPFCGVRTSTRSPVSSSRCGHTSGSSTSASRRRGRSKRLTASRFRQASSSRYAPDGCHGSRTGGGESPRPSNPFATTTVVPASWYELARISVPVHRAVWVCGVL